jgi:BNR repeat-like domain
MLLAVVAAVACLLCGAPAALAAPPSFNTVKIAGEPGQGALPWSEPRIAVGPDGKYWAVTNADDKLGTAAVYGSGDKGAHFQQTPNPPAGQTSPTPDVDIVVLPSGRIIASELDDAGINFPTAYSDDGGKTWTASVGSTQLADQDRQWFAYGPKDPKTGQYPVYLLYHNLASGQAQHNMFVSTSTDSGATFGPPIPITLPGEDAYTDLQCADSGGPSTIFVNQNDGTIYAEFTTRASNITGVPVDAGGCGTIASGQPLEFNIVAATRVWLAQSTDGGQTWTNSLAVDDSPSGKIVSMQVAYGGLDSTGRIYVAYPESPREYPDYSAAAVRYKFASPSKDGDLKWSAPRTFADSASNAPGHVLVHMVAGQPGQLEGFYWTGEARAGKKPVWYMTAAQTSNGLDANPTVSEARMSDVPTDVGTAPELMGACTNFGPVTGIVNGLACGRSPDVWGVALDPSTCRPTVVWPAVNVKDDPSTTDDDPDKAAGSDPGTFVSTQTGGPTLCEKTTSGGRPTAGATGGSCKDKTAPVTRFRKRQASRRRLHFTGTSRDKGCKGANGVTAAGKVRRVYVSVAKVRGKSRHQRCAFLTSRGTLTGFRRCTKPVLLAAKGSTNWSITLKPHTLPKGSYRVVVRAVDAAKNKERPNSGHNIAAFKLR